MAFRSLNIIGIMSGSSMDGLDVAYCQFQKLSNGKIKFKLIQSHTFSYSKTILDLLINMRTMSAKDYFEADAIYGKWIGNKLKQWMTRCKLTPDAIAIHGHTVFHEPKKGFSVQSGNAQQIAAICGCDVIDNFRNLDIAYGGQGAPLVPIGDKLLFANYDACINIGGIANIYTHHSEQAYDICIANMGLNYFANQLNHKFDKDGLLAKKGTIHKELLRHLNSLSFIKQKPPKSLNREYFETKYLPIILSIKDSSHNYLRTFTEHIAINIAKAIQNKNINNVLITGGGAFNKFLITRIKELSQKTIIVPEKNIVCFKEAIIFALIGYLSLIGSENTIAKSTGASKNICTGNHTWH